MKLKNFWSLVCLTKRGKTKPETFDFLGFTHYCNQTRNKRFSVQTMTAKKKLNKAIIEMDAWLKTVRGQNHPKDIWPMLKVKLQGHYNYYGISDNIEGLKQFYNKTKQRIFYWFNRKSQKDRWNWDTFEKYLKRYPLPLPKLTYAIYNTW